MATTQSSGGGHSPKSFAGTVDKALDEARHTGVINLSNRKLKEFPKYGKKYDLRDTTSVGMSDFRELIFHGMKIVRGASHLVTQK